MAVTFSIAINDVGSLATSHHPVILSTATAAAAMWAKYLSGSASIEVEIRVAHINSDRAEGGSATSTFLRTEGEFSVYEQGAAGELRSSIDPNGTSPDIIISIDPDYIKNVLWFDPTPQDDGADIPSNRTDAVSVFLHEIGHGLGFNGWRDGITGNLPAWYMSTFDADVITINGQLYFNGATAKDQYGGPVPLTMGNYSHYGNATGPGSDLTSDGLMNGVVYYHGMRYSISFLDLAILQDSDVMLNVLLGTQANESLDLLHQVNAYGFGGDDVMIGNGLNNFLSGGSGDDTLRGSAGSDFLAGDEGIDTVDYSTGGTVGINVDLLSLNSVWAGYAADNFGTVEVLTNIENIIGTSFSDVVYASNVDNHIEGGLGNDQIVTWGGNDAITGGGGDDVLLGWDGNDVISGGDDNDWLWMGNGADQADGGSGNDVIIGDLPGSVEIGSDSIIGGVGADILIGGAGDDILYGGMATTMADSDAGQIDWLIGGAGNDVVYGGSGDDVIWEQLDFFENGADAAYGGDGNDLILTGQGSDIIDAGVGDDVIYGGSGADFITTSSGADTIWFTSSTDAGDIVSDFVLGMDRVVIYPTLNGSMTTQAAFSAGVLGLQQSGADTRLLFDVDGSLGVATPMVLATFIGVSAGSFVIGTDLI